MTDEGVVAGYAYTHGWRGFPPESTRDKIKQPDWNGDFCVVIMGRDGEFRLDETKKREASRYPHAPPNPIAEGMFVDPENDRFVIRMADDDVNRRMATWRAYRLSDGSRLSDFQPRKHLSGVPRFCDDIAAQPVRGTRLTLTHWWLYENKPGGKFTLSNTEGLPIWTLDLPADYSIVEDQEAEWRLRDSIAESGAILRSDLPRRFDLWHVREKQRVSYEVRPRANHAGEWEVIELARTAYAPPRDAAPNLGTLVLESLGTIQLGEQPRTRPAIRDVDQFGFDGVGRIGFVRRDSDGKANFVLAQPDGTIVAEISVGTPADAKRTEWLTAWLSNDRWIVIGTGWGVDPIHRALLADTGAKIATDVTSFNCPARITKVVSDRRGGFVVRVDGEFDEDGVIRFDADGKQRWRVPRKHSGDDILMSPEDIAVTTDGAVAVVCSFNKLVQMFDSSGRHLRRIELKKCFTREPVYPSEVSADRDGGLIVGDWQGSPPIWRITSKGKLVASILPKYADGRTFSMHFGVSAAPDGRLWTTDGSSLLRLTDTGVVDFVLGETPRADSLGEVSTMAIDQQGCIYLVSRRTTAVHVFDRTGNLMRVCEPLPDDFTTNTHGASLCVASDGEVFVRADGARDGAYLRFGSDGRRIGFVSEADWGSGTDWLFGPFAREHWATVQQSVFLVGANGKTTRTIERRPDRNWLGSIGRTAVAPDSSLAIVSFDSRAGFFMKRTLSIYGPTGESISTIALPFAGYIRNMAFDGQFVVVPYEHDWLIIEVGTGTIRRFTPDLPRTPASNWHCFIISDDHELWLCDPDSRMVHRFHAPSGG